MSCDSISFSPIGYVKSPYKEKFAIPRQPGIVQHACGSILLNGELTNNTNELANLVKGLEAFSHIWVIFLFHETMVKNWKPLVRPPRLGGNDKVGVLATRSTFRPNPIGMSVVKLEEVVTHKHEVRINISGLDLLDNTPVLDIKPYLPYADSLNDAQSTLAPNAPNANLSVSFSEQAISKLDNYKSAPPQLKNFIEEVLAQDPRPAYKQTKDDDKQYGIRLYDFNILWCMKSMTSIEVLDIIDESK